MDTALLVIILIVVAVIVVALAVFFVYRRRRQTSVREEFGPEYDRVVEERGSKHEAERELRERRERVESEIQPLSEESRGRYDEQWQQVERSFVDNPAASLDDADRVVAELLSERNFPTISRQEASKGLGVMYPGIVEDFREAQQIYQDATRSQSGADLEKMRRAIQKYRSVYERLTER